jgi:hypothetical protein
MTDRVKEIRRNEAERCALLAEMLAESWQRSADKLRREGTRKTLFGRERLDRRYERAVGDIEAAIHGLRAVALACRRGYDPRGIERDKHKDKTIELMQEQLTPEQMAAVASKLIGEEL